MDATRTTTSKDGTPIAFERYGRGTAVILVDGAMGYRTHRGGRPLAEALAQHFTVIAYDRRGRGESGDTQPYSVEREIEDIEALIDEVGPPVSLYGFSSGSVLALRAAAALAKKVSKLAVLEPPFSPADETSKREFVEYRDHLALLLAASRDSDAVAYFLRDMIPPPVLDGLRQSPEWSAMTAVAKTLAYDNAVMGDGAVPRGVAADVHAPALILDGSESPEFKHVAADDLAAALPNARRETFKGHNTLVPPEVLAPVLATFFGKT